MRNNVARGVQVWLQDIGPSLFFNPYLLSLF
jgi:hypothetical protein